MNFHKTMHMVLFLLLFGFSVSCSLDDDRTLGKGVQMPYDNAEYASKSIIVKMDMKQDSAPLLALVSGTVDKTIRLGSVRYLVVRISEQLSVTEALGLLKDKSGFILAEPNYIYTKSLVPNDPSYGSQYAHTVTGMATAWDTTTGSTGVAVAVVDTGVNGLHADLAPNMIDGFDCISNTNISGSSNSDQDGHGTHVAGIAAARGNNGTGVAGVAWNSKIMPVRVLDATGSGTSADIAQGIVWAATNAAGRRLIINLSLGGSGFTQIIQDAVQFAIQQNVVIVAAMGNDAQHKVKYPAYLPGVIAVGATDSSDKLASFSTRGKHISVCAPGDGILSTAINGGYVSMSGTSMATPYVSGLCALLLSKDSGLTAGQVRTILELTAVDLGDAGFDDLYGNGRVDAAAALSFSATNRYGAILVRTITPDGPTGNLEVLLCDTNTNVIRSIRTSLGGNQSTVSNGSLMFYYVPSGSYMLRATWGAFRRFLPVTVAASNTAANPAVAVFQLAYSETPLVLGSWAEGVINGTDTRTGYYYLDVTAGQNYVVQWNELNTGTGNYTLDVKASLYHSDRVNTFFANVTSSWAVPQLFTATSNERVWIRIDAVSSAASGTYALCVSQPSTNEIPVTMDTWMSNNLNSYSATYLYFDAVAGEKYSISCDDQSDGSGRFTLDTIMSAYRADKSTSYFTDDTSGYTSGQVITAQASERVYLFIRAASSGYSGSYAIRVAQPATNETPLALNIWTEGYMDPGSGMYYHFDAVAGQQYIVQWDGSSGTGKYNLQASVSAYREDKTTSYFTSLNYGYSSPPILTAQGTEKIYIKMTPSWSGYSGSYAIRITQPITNEAEVALNTWTSNHLEPYCETFHYVNASAGKYYLVYLDDNSSGSWIYSLDAIINIYHEDKKTSYFIQQDNAYFVPLLVPVTTDEKLYVYVKSKNSGYWGSYGLKVMQVSIDEHELSLGSWYAGNIAASIPELCSFNAVAGQMYSIQWDNAYDGTGSYSWSGSVSVLCDDKVTGIVANRYNGYSYPITLVATNTGKLYIKLKPTGESGTFAIRVNAISDPSIPMTINQWKTGYLDNNDYVYLYFNATGGNAYTIQWDDYWGSGSYTLWSEVSAYHGDRVTPIFEESYSGYNYPEVVYIPYSERVYIRVYADWYESGTYAIKASPLATTPTSLVASTWSAGAIGADGYAFYYFYATAGQQYYIQWDDSYFGSGSYSLFTKVSAYHVDGSTAYFTDSYSGYSDPQQITATEDGNIIIKVRPYTSGNTGTFAVRFYQ